MCRAKPYGLSLARSEENNYFILIIVSYWPKDLTQYKFNYICLDKFSVVSLIFRASLYGKRWSNTIQKAILVLYGDSNFVICQVEVLSRGLLNRDK